MQQPPKQLYEKNYTLTKNSYIKKIFIISLIEVKTIFDLYLPVEILLIYIFFCNISYKEKFINETICSYIIILISLP